MRRGHLLIIGFCVAAVAATFAFDFGSDANVSDDATTALPVEISTTDDEHDSSAPPGPALASAARSDARSVVPVSSLEVAAEDPCASVVAELAAASAALADAVRTIEKLNAKLAETIRERDRLTFPADTPYGAFLADYESNDIDDPYALARIQDWLRQFPVFLRPGEATWIAERTAAKDWGLYGRSSEVALILFLGPDRLVAELPPARVTELRAYYHDEPIFN